MTETEDIHKITGQDEVFDLIRVLIIDDLEDNRTLLRLDLEDELDDIEVEEASGGEEGIRMLLNRKFSVVICDLMMPGTDGFAVFKKINNELEASEVPPFIFISANKQKEVVERGLELGAIDFLTKPYELNELINKVRNLARIQSLNESLKQSQTSLSEANKRLNKVNKEKDEMLKVVSHDMRNPLNNIIGMASMLREESRQQQELDTGEVAHMGTMIERNGYKLLDLVTSLLDVAKLESGNLEVKFEETDVARLVRNSVDSIEVLAYNKNLELIADLPDENIYYPMDESMMDRALGNLISNSIKFTSEGGQVWVKLHVKKERKKYPAIQIEVQDNGIGIPEEKQKEIFKKFGSYQRKGTGEEAGSGLGLSNASKFVELQGGTITVSSEQGQGSTFLIEMPATNGHDV